MKTLLATTGGRPLKNEDAKLFEQIIALLEGYYSDLQDGLIISGVEFTGTPGNYTVSPGYIYYAGSLCTFEGAAIATPLPYIMEKFDADVTPRDYFDAATKNTLNLVSIAAQGGGGYSLELTSPRLSVYTQIRTKATDVDVEFGIPDTYVDSEKLRTAIDPEAWRNPTYEANFSNGTPVFQYRVRGLNEVEFRGEISTAIGASLAFTLPIGYRPANDVYINVLTGVARDISITVKIASNGEVSSVGWSGVTILSYFNTSYILD